MFKVPDWEADIPQSNINFGPKSHKKKATDGNLKKTVAQKTFPVKSLSPTADKKNKTLHNSVKKAKQKVKSPVFNNNKKIKPINNMTRSPQNTRQNGKTIKNSFDKIKKTKLDKIDFEEVDKILLNAKRKKLNEEIENEDQEVLLFSESKSKIMEMKKKDKLKKMLSSHRSSIRVDSMSAKLRDRMMERLKAAQFRYLNEKLYTSSGADAQQLFQADPAAFQTYHQGYQLQVKKWPVNPLNVIVKQIFKLPKTYQIADMGCGEATLAKRVPHTVRSFDLVACSPAVEACDMAHTPLLTSSMDVVVYCLALMGTELTKYLLEASRVLKMGGQLLIAEVESRFQDVDAFCKDVERLGFKLKNLDKSNTVFFFMQFNKIRDPPVKKGKLPEISLNPCLYKRR